MTSRVMSSGLQRVASRPTCRSSNRRAFTWPSISKRRHRSAFRCWVGLSPGATECEDEGGGSSSRLAGVWQLGCLRRMMRLNERAASRSKGGQGGPTFDTVLVMSVLDFVKAWRTSKRPEAAGADAPQQAAAEAPVTKTRRRLFTKYVVLFVAVVCIALLSNGIFDVFFYYQEHRASLIRTQRDQAEAAAAKIGQFIKEIESQLGWTTQLPWSAGSIEQRRFDALRLLRQVPAITELAQLDATGKERLRVSRLAMDVVASGADLSNDPKFAEAVARKVYYGPVYFRRESEPYMTLAIAGTRRDAGVSVAEVNLKLIWDVVSQIKVGERGHAYVVDAQG